MKKLLIAPLAVVFALAMTMSPAFASSRGDDGCCDHRDRDKKECCPKTTVESTNETSVLNVTASVSNTGKNYIGGKADHSSRHHNDIGGWAVIGTGEAFADALGNAEIGYNELDVTAPEKGTVEVASNNNSRVANFTVAAANSGRNSISGKGEITTGNASAVTTSTLLVGTNMVKVSD